MSMTITNAGVLSTVQDSGRLQFMSSGFSPAGVMDEISYKYANMLCMNSPFSPVIEMTMFGVSAVFDSDAVIAVTGADMSFCINDKPIKRYCAIEVKSGDVLSSGKAVNGFRSYLAVAGGFKANYEMASYSTDMKCGIGGIDGRKLAMGDKIEFEFSRECLLRNYDFKIPEISFNDREITLRVVLGPQREMFTKKGLDTFLNSEYTLTAKSDRMGLRLDGEKIESVNSTDIISDPISFGAVQIPSSGKPIIMAADRQTVGGYAKIANVIKADMSLLAQAPPDTKINFSAVSAKEAVKIYRKKIKEIENEEGLLFNNGLC